MSDFDGWKECSKTFIDAHQRSKAQIFPEYRARLAELIAEAKEIAEMQDAAKNDAQRALYAARGDLICARIWVYRGSAPICRYPEISLKVMREYMVDLCKEIEQDITDAIRDGRTHYAAIELERLFEVHRAQRVLSKYSDDMPLF